MNQPDAVPPSPSCFSREVLRQFLDGLLSEPAHSKVEQHVEFCPLCGPMLESLEEGHDLLMANVGRSAEDEGSPLGNAFVAWAALGAVPNGALGSAGHPEPVAEDERYRIRRHLADGGLGHVSVAFDAQLERKVALKEIQSRYADLPSFRARFEREALITGRLEHPGIVPVYSFGRGADGRPFYVMRFIRGECLEKAIARFHVDQALTKDPGRRSLELQQLLRRFQDVCNTIRYAHSRGVIHRDLKPRNIMLGPDGETLVVDWGLAKVMGMPADDTDEEETEEPLLRPQNYNPFQTNQGTALGTPGFMSPEQARGDPERVGPASDVYSLGAILYSVLTGEAPFTRANAPATRRIVDELILRGVLDPSSEPAAVSHPASASVERVHDVVLEKLGRSPGTLSTAELQRVTTPVMLELIKGGELLCPKTLVPWVDPALEAVCLKALALNPEDRYISPRELAEDLDRWHADEPVGAWREPWTMRARRYARRHTRALSVAASVLIVTVLVGAAAWRWLAVKRQNAADEARNVLMQAGALEDQARAGADPTSWAQSRAAVERAQSLLEFIGGNTSLREEVRRRVARLKQSESDVKVVSALEEAQLRATAILSGKYDRATAEERYRQVFLDYGIDVHRLRPEEVARKVRESTVRESLIAALDDWSGHATGDQATRLEAIIRLADADQVRIAARAAIAVRDLDTLRRLSQQSDPASWSPTRSARVGRALLDLGEIDGAVSLLSTAQRHHPDHFYLNHELGRTSWKSGQHAEAVRYYAIAVALRPRSPSAHANLGTFLATVGKRDDATEEFRIAIRLDPEFDMPHNSLGAILALQGQIEPAIAEYRTAIRLNPNSGAAHANLAATLLSKGQPDEAIRHCRLALTIDPNSLPAMRDLGRAQAEKGSWDEAIATYQAAMKLDRNDAVLHYSLGRALGHQRRDDEAIDAYRAALQIKPDYSEAHNNLANIHLRKGLINQAIEEYRLAVKANARNVEARSNLGGLLVERGAVDEGISHLRAALGVKPDFAAVRYQLARALAEKKAFDESIREFQETIRLQPGFAEAHYYLAVPLIQTGRFSEALAEMERGHALGSGKPDWSVPSAQGLSLCRKLVALEARLPAILSGSAQPRDVTDRLQLADVCGKKRLHAAATRLYDEAFLPATKATLGILKMHRYNAACSAALAGVGECADDPPPDDATRARLRRQALDWLHAELSFWANVLLSGSASDRATLPQTLRHWRSDPDLAGLRDEARLAKLSEAERQACQEVWARVDALLRQATANASSNDGLGAELPADPFSK